MRELENEHEQIKRKLELCLKYPGIKLGILTNRPQTLLNTLLGFLCNIDINQTLTYDYNDETKYTLQNGSIIEFYNAWANSSDSFAGAQLTIALILEDEPIYNYTVERFIARTGRYMNDEYNLDHDGFLIEEKKDPGLKELLDAKKELEAIMTEYRKHSADVCGGFYSKTAQDYGLDMGSRASVIIDIIERYFNEKK